MLSQTHADNYNDWMYVGWCLHSISQEYLDVWIQFSKRSKKFKHGECEQIWSTIKDRGLTIRSLHNLVKKDNPENYEEVFSNNIFALIVQNGETDEKVSTVAYDTLKKHHVCCDSSTNTWYFFNGTRWVPDVGLCSLKKAMSTKVRDVFKSEFTRMENKANIDNLSSVSKQSMKEKTPQSLLLDIAYKLENNHYRKRIIEHMTPMFQDLLFYDRLDENPNVIAFKNGVWELKEKRFRTLEPEDMISIGIDYDYIPERNDTYYSQVQKYWKTMHPQEEQREYLLKTIARQMYGDHGANLLHMHAGYLGSAANGKTTFFDLMDKCFGEYVRKFGVELLVAKARSEYGRPMPEYHNWKGRRILYCTEPKSEDMLNSGVLKEITGGEKMMYRLMYSNQTHTFDPQFKMHIMCNDPPQVDGGDEVVKRRIRKVDYISRFVPKEEVDESNNLYLRDDDFISNMKNNTAFKMEFSRYILDHYDHDFHYKCPSFIESNSKVYLTDNDSIRQFVEEYIAKDPDGFFTLKDLKEAFKGSHYYSNTKAIGTLKNDIIKILRCNFVEQKMINTKKYKNVFLGYNLCEKEDF